MKPIRSGAAIAVLRVMSAMPITSSVSTADRFGISTIQLTQEYSTYPTTRLLGGLEDASTATSRR